MVHAVRLGLASGLLVFLVLARRTTGTWANPVGFYAGTFLVVVVSQEALLPSLPFGEPMAALVLGSTGALFLGMAITCRSPCMVVDPRPAADDRRTLRTVALYAAYAVPLLYLYEILQARSTGLGVTETGVFDRAAFYEAGGQSTTMRALQALTYCSALFVGFEVRHRRRPVLLTLAFLGIVFVQGLALSSKLPILLNLLLFTALAAVGYPSKFRYINRRLLAGTLGGLLMVVVTFHAVTLLRHRGATDTTATMAFAVLGGPSAYSVLLDTDVSITFDQRWGLTFAGIRDVILGGEDTRALGVYAESVTFDLDRPDESRVNVYSWFMPLRHDFGIPGALIVIFGLGLLAGALTSRQVAGDLGHFGQVCLALLNMQLMFAPIFVLTYYNFLPLLLVTGGGLALLYRRHQLVAATGTVSAEVGGTDRVRMRCGDPGTGGSGST
jgi:oligosaccharide repeat unit polymerase